MDGMVKVNCPKCKTDEARQWTECWQTLFGEDHWVVVQSCPCGWVTERETQKP